MNDIKRFLSYPFRKIRQYAKKVRETPRENRRHIEKGIFFLTIAVFIIFTGRLMWIIATDKVSGVSLSAQAQQNFKETQAIQAKRGTIYDRNGVPIAIDSSSYTIYVTLDDRYVDNKGNKLYAQPSEFPQIAKLLHDKLDIDEDYAMKQLTRKGSLHVEFGSQGSGIDYSTKDSIEKEVESKKIKGIGFTPHLSRSYPNGQFASHFIGMATLQDQDDESKGLVGQNGIEASMDAILRGRDGSQTLQKNKLGITLPGTDDSITSPKDGQDVYTTLDATLQTYLETLLDTAAEDSQAKEIVATLVKADTGEILATSQRPTFNPDTQEGLTTKKNKNFTWNNLLYQANFEPGSTMKVFTLASAIESGVFNPDEYYTSGELKIADGVIHDWDWGVTHQGRTMNFAQGFSYSSNIGMTLLEQKMGDNTWRKYLNRFQFGRATAMGVGSEARGQLPDTNVVTTAMSSFGQGISVTDLQMLRGFLAISNSGTMLEPHFISQIVDGDTVKQSAPEIVGKPVSVNSANQTLQYMINVGTDPENGTAYDQVNHVPSFQVNGQNVSVKTGTAQVAEDGTGYLTGQYDYLYSAVVITPSENPEFIMYMTVKLPSSWKLSYISNVANPLLSRASEIKDSLTVANTDLTTAKVKLKNYKGKNPTETAEEMRREILSPVIVGSGKKITKQSISSGTKVDANRRVLLLTDGKITMPDIYGWSKYDVQKLADWLELKVEFEGTGDKVISQSIDTDDKLTKNKKLTVNLGV